jgi:hypothetical protein
MRRQPFRRQVTFYIEQEDWQRLVREAARQRVPVAEVCRRELAPLLRRLTDTNQSPGWDALTAACDAGELPTRPGSLNRRDHPWRQQAFPQTSWETPRAPLPALPETERPRSLTSEQSLTELPASHRHPPEPQSLEPESPQTPE